jgi:hypothetical protein
MGNSESNKILRRKVNKFCFEFSFPRSSINTYKKWLSVCNTTEEEEKRNNLKVCNFCFDPVAFQSAYEISLKSTAIPRSQSLERCLENLVEKCRLCFTEGSKANPVLRVENAFLERELTGIEVSFHQENLLWFTQFTIGSEQRLL